MIQLPAGAQVLIWHESISFRNGIDGLGAVVATLMGRDPMDGAFYVFRSRSHQALRLLFHDGSGFWLAHKRLSKGTFRWWPRGDGAYSPLLIRELQILIWGGDPASGRFPAIWRKIA